MFIHPIIQTPKRATSSFSANVSELAAHRAPIAFADGCMAIKITVDGKAGWFILDNQSPVSWISPTFLKGVTSLKAGPRFNVAGFDAATSFVSHIQAGGALLSNILFIDHDYPSNPITSKIHGEPVVGDLGYNALRMTTIAIDYDRCQAYLWGPAMGSGATKTFFGRNRSLDTTPVKLDFASCSVDCTINGSPIQMQLFLASPYCSVIGHPAWESDTNKWGPVTDSTSDQKFYTLGLADQMKMGNVSATNVPITLEGQLNFLGWMFFSSLHQVVFDLQSGHIYYPQQTQKLNMIGGFLYMKGVVAQSNGDVRIRDAHANVQSFNGGNVLVSTESGIPIDKIDDSMSMLKRVDALDNLIATDVTSVTVEAGGQSKNVFIRNLIVYAPSCPLPPKASAQMFAFAKCFAGGPGIYIVTGNSFASKAEPGSLRWPKGKGYDGITAVGINMPKTDQPQGDAFDNEMIVPDDGSD